MLKLTKRDWVTLGVIAAVIGVLILGARAKTKQVPRDAKHRAFFAALAQGRDRRELEKRCVACHNPQASPLPKKHPPKEQCLICHKLGYSQR